MGRNDLPTTTSVRCLEAILHIATDTAHSIAEDCTERWGQTEGGGGRRRRVGSLDRKQTYWPTRTGMVKAAPSRHQGVFPEREGDR